MATREENLKKINEELEKLSDEELDEVAGGDCYEMADDSRFLNSLNGSVNRYGATHMWLYHGTRGPELQQAWAKLGIEMTYKGGMNWFKNSYGYNTYKLDGKQITQEEARQHAMEVTGHYMEEKDWKW